MTATSFDAPARLTTRSVEPYGPIDADIIVVGEAPGAQEDLDGRPFVGPAGHLLTKLMTSAGIVRSTVCLTNVFTQRPPNNQVRYYFRDASCTTPTEEGQAHIEVFKAWLSRRKPNLVVALGATALYVLTGKTGIDKWRGSLLESTLVPGLKVYPSYHPSFIQRMMNESQERAIGEQKKFQQNLLTIAVIDWKRIAEQAKTPLLPITKEDYHINLSYQQCLSYLDRLYESPNIPEVSVDIETLPGEPYPLLWCIGFAPTPETAFVIPFLHLPGGTFAWTPPQEAELFQRISRIFLKPTLKKIFQNCFYDLVVLGKVYGLRVATGSLEDTMFCHHATYPGIKKDLGTLASIYTYRSYYKDEGKFVGGRNNDYAEFMYNCKDTTTTREIYPILKWQAQQHGTLEGYQRTLTYVPSLLAMMLGGVRIDLSMKEVLTQDFGQKALYYGESIKALAAQRGFPDFNPASPKQLESLLYISMGFPVQYGENGKPTTDKEAIKKLKRAHKDENSQRFLQDLLNFRNYAKLKSTYADMKVAADGKVYTSYGFVSTWRLSSSESVFGVGGNLQNIPTRTAEGKLVRKLFLPDEGHLMIAADLSQAEARVVAWEANDLAAIENFLSGVVDIHWENAKQIFSLPQATTYEPKQPIRVNITGLEHTHKDLRTIGKTVVHASNYGMGPGRLQSILALQGFHLSSMASKALLARRHSANPCIRSWQAGIRDKISRDRVLISSFGRKRTFGGRLSEELFKAAYAFSPQNTVGEILTYGIQKLWDTSPHTRPLLNVHDEVVASVAPEHIPEAAALIKAALEYPLRINNRDLIIPCDFKLGRSWGELEEISYADLITGNFKRT